MTSEGIRINKYLAEAGLCSRREADRLIASGEVTINGERASLSDRVFSGDAVKWKGKRILPVEEKTVVAYYKPVGVTCTAKDPHAKKTLSEAFSYPVRLTYAGRLDRDSEGLLLMTNDGDLIERMMRGENGHEKEYVVRCKKKLSDYALRKMAEGIYLKELQEKTRPCTVVRLGDRTFSITLTQGLNRQIRRMVAALDNEVKTLKRTRVLTVRIGSLKPGEKRELSRVERQALYEAAGREISEEKTA